MRRVLSIVSLMAGATALMAALRWLFMLWTGGYWGHMWSVLWHGLPMDLAVAAYIAAPVALALMVSAWLPVRWGPALRRGADAYLAAVAGILSLIYCADAALYPYWGFKLDTTPIFYFTTGPAAAMASLAWWKWAAWGAATVVAGIASWLWLRLCLPARCFAPARRRWAATAAMAAACGLMVIAMRGGVSVATMSPGRVYFSTDMRLNHGAINPAFNLLYSATHAARLDKQFRFTTDEEAAAEAARLNVQSSPGPRVEGRPDVYIIILESFSAHLMPSLGGEPVALRLDSLARTGWLFTDAYASSFRTDRALPAIVCSYPAQPTASILKHVPKLEGLPSLPRLMKDAGYDMTYYYGGDIDFTNVRAMVNAAGFDRIVSDADFPLAERMSKWGAPDGAVFSRALADARAAQRPEQPRMAVIQTSSSHEPYDVPYDGGSGNRKVNAFQYADSCLGAFADQITRLPRPSLMVIVPDHYGSWPEDLSEPAARHHIPLVLCGTALEGVEIDPALLSLPASQTDIGATVAGLLGIDHSSLPFSHNLLAPRQRPAAFFSEPSWIAMRTPGATAVLSVDTQEQMTAAPDSVYTSLRAYAQTLYTDLAGR